MFKVNGNGETSACKVVIARKLDVNPASVKFATVNDAGEVTGVQADGLDSLVVNVNGVEVDVDGTQKPVQFDLALTIHQAMHLITVGQLAVAHLLQGCEHGCTHDEDEATETDDTISEADIKTAGENAIAGLTAMLRKKGEEE
jgi:hypothetical protein